MPLQLIETHQSFAGIQKVYSHWSQATKTEMRFALYLPPAAQKKPVPALYWLSGLTCSEQNFITKAGAQRIAAQLGIALVTPDTSPRKLAYTSTSVDDNFGEGAGFYLDARIKPWCEHYQMYTYISEELPHLITHHFPIDKARNGIFGHSMGGHGALVIGLRNPERFQSLSAFAPICSPSITPWGINAFSGYLGENQHTWLQYDATELIKRFPWPHGDILIDQGTADPFLVTQLKPELLKAACAQVDVPLTLRLQEGYDHSYYFIATFIEDHLRFHAHNLGAAPTN